MLHISPTMTDDLCSEIETRYRLEVDRNPFLRPFALKYISCGVEECIGIIYSTKFITFKLLRLAPSKSSLVNKDR